VANDKRALVLFSGGLDSTTTLAIALSEGYKVYAFTIDYHQRHSFEIEASKKVLQDYPDVRHVIFNVDLSVIGGSALTDTSIDVPTEESDDIPVTYVPARNTIFLSLASSFAEKHSINNIFIGVNSIDYSGYPDCRPEFIELFEKMINKGTKLGVEGTKINIHTPLIQMKKSDIIKIGVDLNVNYTKTVSCYSLTENGEACGICDSCRFRKQGFLDAGVPDPTLYKKIK